MLGGDVCAEATSWGVEFIAPGRDRLDLSDLGALPERLSSPEFQADVVINCAAYTAVDKAESEPEAALRLNAAFPAILAEHCRKSNRRLIHLSTDFVYDGETDRPYVEDDLPGVPLGVYGQTKLAGEIAVRQTDPGSVIVRTAWLYGPSGSSFPKTMIRAWRAGKSLRVVADQWGTPTYTADLARTLFQMLELPGLAGGIYHAAGAEIVTWFDFAKLTIETYKNQKNLTQDVLIEKIRTEDWPTPARRPRYSALNCDKLAVLGIAPMRPLGEALLEFADRVEIGG